MRQFRADVHEMLPNLDDFIAKEGDQWMVDERLGKLIDALGSRMALSMRQSFFQSQGVDAKLRKSVDKAFATDLMDGSGIGGILEIAGLENVANILKKNPKTLNMILQRAGPLLQSFTGQKNNSGSKSSGGAGYS